MRADHRKGRSVPEGFMGHAMYAAIVDGELVGRAGIRFELNEILAYRYGNVGYGVVEQHRGKSYATGILRQSLIILANEGVSPVLVTCWDHNVGSGKVIENNGGLLESILPDKDGVPFRRYWVTV
jgi:predicted acetyltransferase